jgi:hypothetical protein
MTTPTDDETHKKTPYERTFDWLLNQGPSTILLAALLWFAYQGTPAVITKIQEGYDRNAKALDASAARFDAGAARYEAVTGRLADRVDELADRVDRLADELHRSME